MPINIHPDSLCHQHHERMPLLIHPDDIDYWLYSPSSQLSPLLEPPADEVLRVTGC